MDFSFTTIIYCFIIIILIVCIYNVSGKEHFDDWCGPFSNFNNDQLKFNNDIKGDCVNEEPSPGTCKPNQFWSGKEGKCYDGNSSNCFQYSAGYKSVWDEVNNKCVFVLRDADCTKATKGKQNITITATGGDGLKRYICADSTKETCATTTLVRPEPWLFNAPTKSCAPPNSYGCNIIDSNKPLWDNKTKQCISDGYTYCVNKDPNLYLFDKTLENPKLSTFIYEPKQYCTSCYLKNPTKPYFDVANKVCKSCTEIDPTKQIWNDTVKQCVTGNDANCKSINSNLPIWNDATKKCECPTKDIVTKQCTNIIADQKYCTDIGLTYDNDYKTCKCSPQDKFFNKDLGCVSKDDYLNRILNCMDDENAALIDGTWQCTKCIIGR